MKKFLKVIIAFVLIAAIAFGVYFIFFNKSKNSEIYAKVNYFNNGITKSYEKNGTYVENENVVDYVKTQTCGMFLVIENYNMNLPEVKKFVECYTYTISAYDNVNQAVMQYGLFTNKTNNTKTIKKMNKSAQKLEKLYLEAHSYLLENYDDTSAQAKATIMQQYHNMFKGSIGLINDFNYNAGKAIVRATKNLANFNNLGKLKLDFYVELVNLFVNAYLETGELDQNIKNHMDQFELSLNASPYVYLQYKAACDNMFKNLKNIKVAEMAKQYAAGTIDTYINGLSEEEKSTAENYYNLVIRG